jgi:hypothetical protein
LPRSFFIFAGIMSIMAGSFYSAIKTGRYGTETLDKLGKDFELSRMIKQDIFDTRPDLDSGIRAQYYMNQQKRNEKMEEEIANLQRSGRRGL